jgi:hypothetical protein
MGGTCVLEAEHFLLLGRRETAMALIQKALLGWWTGSGCSGHRTTV